MILFYKDFHINKDKIKFKKSRQCSKDFTFIPIQYDKKDFIIQTPQCFVPFGLKKYSTNLTDKVVKIKLKEAVKYIDKIIIYETDTVQKLLNKR